MPPAKQGRELPSKESAMFKSILKFYEHKQYKKGLKQAEQILRKFPEHGETLAMKGLFLSHLDRKEEGYEFVKKGLRNDLTSHTCWHVYGLMHRADKNYEEAIKCYVNALKFDKENMQIIRDLSLLQIQMRNYEGFNETRHQLLSLRPTNRMYWVGLAISYHMLQKYDTALNVLSAFEESLKEQPDVADFENSEMLMYKNMIIEESGDNLKALEHLEDIRTRVVDKRSWRESKARVLLKANKLTEAEVEYRQLLDQNPDCHAYLEGLLRARSLIGGSADLDVTQMEKLFRLLNELGNKYPRSHVIKRAPLKYAKADKFRELADEYLRPMFRKGVPSLFVSIKDLYKDDGKGQIVEDLVLGYRKSLKEAQRFGEDDALTEREPPTAYLWVLYFLAQHYDHKRNTTTALQLINEALVHTPTLVELLMTKARIYKHAGDEETAVTIMNEAREMDLQDRYINSKCTKYMLRNDRLGEAEQTIALFTRSESLDPLADLVDMQCMWFATECAKSYVRQEQYGRALKKLHQIEQHFVDIYDDQFDFHSYCLRKMTLRSYVELLRVEDKLRSHPFYFEAATLAVQVYLELHDKPKEHSGREDASNANVSDSERKKAERKARKLALKTQNDKAADAGSNKDKADVNGEKYLAADDYLEEAMRFLRPLLDLGSERIESQVLGCEVFLRKKKYLLALRALKKGTAIAPNHPDLHRNAVRFYLAVKSEPIDSIHPHVRTVLEEEMGQLFNGVKDAKEFNAKYLKNCKGNVESLLAAAEMDRLCGGDGVEILEEIVTGETRDLTLETAVKVHMSLVTTFSDLKKADDFELKCRERFPLAGYFEPTD
ncbi:peptide alpha-N-acetyltransferase complex A subunit NAT1 [Spizellomyces punctatus DAOM BR117]|uniref:N-alpha-acetyltransferase 15, NatA auxiliary subunit n=1 Tax=Spizellomyces punctatus (strain DAOM BR117) TaxID=645134 RepID=A0A0L0HA42_SPIPD|nr:peptide alpha-N-acetyltransferase complex A subunit NAT1 [Spizellomyces punctatus DAOM BR117]KNC98047.1 hypothetical protein SPPG_06461 [Spizellomyces punctatus DAOM BR117]|eukprot:XP_016606087.1 hypothetical protein SPPG_06461 [Spizellomyces punctatus DAOM BR117]